jgi:hypothetical protein
LDAGLTPEQKAPEHLYLALMASIARRQFMKTLKLQGFGHHTSAEQGELAIRDIQALAILVGEKAFLMGDRPCGANAAVGRFGARVLAPVFVTPLRTAIERHEKLSGYRDRILRHYFPQWNERPTMPKKCF